MLSLLVLCLVPVGITVVFSLLNVARSRLKHIPGPSLARFTGLYRVHLVWSGQCAKKIEKLHSAYGPIVRTGPNHVLLSDPAAMFAIYGAGTKFKKTDFYRIFALFYNGKAVDTVFSTRDAGYHKVLKAQVAPRFSHTSLRLAEPTIDRCNRVFLQSIRDREGERLDLAEWLKYWAFDVNSALGFRDSFGFMEKAQDINRIIGGIDEGFHYGAIVGQIPEWNAWLFENKAIMGLLRTVTGLGDPTTEIVQMIEERLENRDKGLGQEGDCLLAWLQEERRKPGNNISHADMVMHLANYFVAGSVATATSLAGVFSHLLTSERARNCLIREIRIAETGKHTAYPISHDETLRLPYLQAVLKEGMRLCPTNNIPLERYVPSEGINLCGYSLPGGTNVGISAHMIHRNPAIYGNDADKFRPERWIDGDASAIKEMEKHFFAFGRGDRSCSGRAQAMMEMGKLLTQVLREFDMEWAEVKEDWDVRSYWMPEHRGLIVNFKTRTEKS